ncbi:MAG: hypothetical protein KTR24_17090 [Saprospiraceae bacterium]|nr:hypothetical protein [Saprospiraceae bacterium]
MEDWEKRVRDDREEFDHVEMVPRDAMWQGISNRLDQPRRLPVVKWVGIAASMALVFMAGMFYQRGNGGEEVATLPIEWQAEEDRYQELIAFKKQEIGFDTFQSQRYPDLFAQLTQLDAEYEEAIVDYQAYPEKEALFSILIKYHERQLKVLEQLSRESDRNKIKEETYEKKVY